jgi:hypothetical protein
MKKLITITMIMVILSTLTLSTFAAGNALVQKPKVTVDRMLTPNSNQRIIVFEVGSLTAAKVLFDTVSNVRFLNDMTYIYGTNFGFYAFKNGQCSAILFEKKNVPYDVKNYTYSYTTKKFTKIAKK